MSTSKLQLFEHVVAASGDVPRLRLSQLCDPTALAGVELKPLRHPSTLTAADWQIFDDDDQEHTAAAELNEALIAALAAPDETAAWDILVDTMSRWTDLGALDTEPRAVARQYTDAVFVFGRPEVISAR
jgi:hypothetical protein